ncbi:MAG: ABC transporter substrate-binding protein [Chroococcidiopsidaceae cyanobacterium CP_BM_ER_R8_30]|nr:ABC transporter substrate-binding protein [Chroococcidiopsidaceae cyanobacterium CP_BM_ER_R8_30]
MTHTSSPRLNTIHELWYTRCPVPNVSSLALDLGRLEQTFATDGIQFRSLRASEDPTIRASHYDHKLPGLFREGGNVPAIWARSNKQNTQLIALTWVDEYQAILTLPDSEINKPANLRDRRLALPKRGKTHVDFARSMALKGFLSALSLAGLDETHVEFVDIVSAETDLREPAVNTSKLGNLFSTEVDALLHKTVDAIYVKGAVGVDLATLHDLKVVVDLGAHPDPLIRVNNGTPRTITVDAELIEQRPDLVARYLACLIETAEWAESHAQEVVRVVSTETGGGAAGVRKAYGSELHRRLRPRLSSQFITGLKAHKEFLLRWGFIESDFDIDAWINPTPLVEAEKLTHSKEVH